VAETRQGVCLPAGAVRRIEKPVFCWVRLKRRGDGDTSLGVASTKLAQDIQQGRKLVVARAEVKGCALKQDVSLGQRRSARPPRQPYIAAGSDLPVWAPWQIQNDDLLRPTTLGLRATVDTSSAHFMTPPAYSARIDGPRPYIRDDQSAVILDGQLWVQEPITTSEFDAVLLLIPLSVDDLTDLIDEVVTWANQNWRVVWFGVEG
jgi:hypothetical protein